LVRPNKVAFDANQVTVQWSDGHVSVFANRNLREACPCAMCQGEAMPLGGARALPVLSEIPDDIRPTEYRMVGLYAIAFVWSDGHSTGIYPYDYLLQRCECDACMAKKK
jgi:DUF971 family protein